MSRVRSTVLTLLLLALAHPLFTLLLVVGPVLVAAFHAWEFLLPPLAWAVFAVAGRLLDREPLPGVPVAPRDEPGLAALVSEVAEQLGVRRPLAVRLLPVPMAAVYDQRLRGAPASVVLLGWPLVKHLSVDELRAVIAHELAHRQHLDDRWLGQLLRARAQLAEAPPRFARHWSRTLLRATQPAAFAQELAADVASAEVTGADAIASGLVRSDRLELAYEMLAASWVDALAERKSWPEDLYEAMAQALDDPLVQHALERTQQQQPEGDVDDSHPSTQARLAAIGGTPTAEPGPPIVLREPAELEHQVAELFAEPGEEPVSVLALDPDEHSNPAEDRTLQADLLEATRSDDARELLTALHHLVVDGQWRELAERLQPDVRHAPAAERELAQRVIAGTALSRTLVPALRAAGWQRASRWVRSPLVSPDGAVVEVRDVVDAALLTGGSAELDRLVDVAQQAPVQP
jgi:Zn-dependent protease with chaperone function